MLMQPYRHGSKYNSKGGVGALTLIGVSSTGRQPVTLVSFFNKVASSSF